jgi:PIN domain nuclease of toxin-antitoxin system
VLLLDTHALIWIVAKAPMSSASLVAVRKAARTGDVLVSPVSAWELGLLATARRSSIRFLPTLQKWWEKALSTPGVRLTPLLPEAAIEAAFLPGKPHRDPADRLLIATARQLGATLITRDKLILAYARQGHLDAIPC